jgi:gamma-glutamylcyclotransferase (GGCT)/AIG2-like uncharacterized protein YtfP
MNSLNKSIKYALITLFSFLILTFGYLWLIFSSPFLYNPPKNLPIIEEKNTYTVFVYGTLTKPWVRWLVMGRSGEGKPAELLGFRKDKLNIIEDDKMITKGKLIKVNAYELRALDRYERLGVRYDRIEVTLKDGKSAWVYKLVEPPK